MSIEAAPEALTDETEVAVIGCGPVGAMLANLLRHQTKASWQFTIADARIKLARLYPQFE